MKIPLPQANESRSDYLLRAMADPASAEAYADSELRYGAIAAAYDKHITDHEDALPVSVEVRSAAEKIVDLVARAMAKVTGRDLPPASTDSNSDSSKSEETRMNKRKETVDALIANGKFVETDRDDLTKMGDETFARLTAASEAKPSDAEVKAEAEKIVAAAAKAEADKIAADKAAADKVEQDRLAANAAADKDAPKQLSKEDWLKTAPKEVVAVYEEAEKAREAEKATLVASIRSHSEVFEEAELQARGLDELRKLDKAIQPKPNFEGKGLAFSRFAQDDKLEYAPMPAIKW